MTVPAYTNACVPEQAFVTIQQTNLSISGVAAFLRTYSTRDGGLTFNSARTVIVLPTVPIAAGALHVYEEGIQVAPAMYTLLGQVLTFAAAVPAGRHIDMDFISTVPGSEANAVQIGTIHGWDDAIAVPDGYLRCDGSAVSRTTYAALFAVVGTTYGAGDASTTFNVPDQDDKIIKA